MLSSGTAPRVWFCALPCARPGIRAAAESALVPADPGRLFWLSDRDAVHEEPDHLGSIVQHRCRRLPHQGSPGSCELGPRDVSELVLVGRRQSNCRRDAFVYHGQRYAGALRDVSLPCYQGNEGLNGAVSPGRPDRHGSPGSAHLLRRRGGCRRPCRTSTACPEGRSRRFVAGFNGVV